MSPSKQKLKRKLTFAHSPIICKTSQIPHKTPIRHVQPQEAEMKCIGLTALARSTVKRGPVVPRRGRHRADHHVDMTSDLGL